MDDEDTLKRAIQASADEDVASFIESLDKDVGTGIPDPPKIVIDEVSATPAELELMPFGTSGSQTQPHGAGSPPPPPPVEETGACCIGEDCSIRAEGQCVAMGGEYQGNDTECDPNPCIAECSEVTLCKCGHTGFSGDAEGCVDPCNDQPGVYQTRDYCAGETCPECSGIVHTGFAYPFPCCSRWWLTLTASCEGAGCEPGVVTYDPFDNCAESGSFDCDCDGCATFTVSDEYTTELLIDNALAKFAETCSECPEGYVITHTLNENETCCTVFCEMRPCNGCGFLPLEFAGPTYYSHAERGCSGISASGTLIGTERFLTRTTIYGPFPDCGNLLSGTVTVTDTINPDDCSVTTVCEGSISDPSGPTCDCMEYCGQSTDSFELWCDNCTGVNALIDISSVTLSDECTTA